MFCTSLRRRKSYAAILNSLTLRSSLGLRENDLRTHDVSLPLSSQINQSTGNTHSTRQLRLLLLSPSNISNPKLPSTLERIQRFASLTGGKDLAIIFLLYPGNDTTEEASTAGMLAYARLQAEMMNHVEIPSIPILPMTKLEGLADLLKSHQAALAAPRPSKRPVSNTASFDLLRQCSTSPPMSKEAAFPLTDLFEDLREMAGACVAEGSSPGSSSPMGGVNGGYAFGSGHGIAVNSTQQTDDGNARAKLKDYHRLQGEHHYRDLVEFWKIEYAI